MYINFPSEVVSETCHGPSSYSLERVNYQYVPISRFFFLFLAPSAAPNLTISNITGTTIDIKIGNISAHEENGIIQYYNVTARSAIEGIQKERFYIVEGKYHGTYANSDHSSSAQPCSVVQEYSKTSQEVLLKIVNLTYYTDYSLAGAACTKVGCGPFTTISTVETDEYIPFCPPHGISVTALSSTQLRVRWERPYANCSNGLIIKYKLLTYYQHWDGSGFYLSFENFTQATTLDITQLRKYSDYCVNITAFTSKGHGPYSGIHCQKTLQDSKSNRVIFLFF